jgi:serine phosphatase RsbU (regulator of sigma subunit)
LLTRFLKQQQVEFSIVRVIDRDGFTGAIATDEFDLIIADHTLPSFSGMEAFRFLKARGINIPFILVTGTVSEKMLTEYSKEGIDDYILKDNLLRLPSSIQNVINRKKLEVLYKKLESAHQDIRDSINYAKIIQDAILPERTTLFENFPNSFIFFKPKDVLSGDFYWYERLDGKFLFAVADCTGHSVPGALLAVMGNNLLQEAVNVKRLSNPALVLERLNSQVQEILKQRITSLHDGMDIAFCCIDLYSKTMLYSGANRPLIILREGEVIEYKPNKIPIGGAEKNGVTFDEIEIALLEKDRLFIFSDGYADQFNGQTGKKLLSKRFKKLLTTTAHLPVMIQKRLLVRYFEKWKGVEDQVDDVLLMCIEI